jgi:hypothetical protein
MARVVENAAIQNTMLTGFYDINRDYARREEHGMEIDRQKDSMKVEMPEHFTWDNVRYCWKPRQRFHKGIGRLVFIGPLQAICFIYVFC